MTTSTTLTAWIDGIGVLGPGLATWPAARAILAGSTEYVPQAIVFPTLQMLPPAERRRVGKSVKVALAVAQEAVTDSAQDASQLASVFSSSSADVDNCDAICQALATDDRQLSPTRFTNSVHNAPAGYWGIASGAMAPATVLCAYDGSFGAGLLEALAQVAVDGLPVLLATYDMPYPEPLNVTRPLAGTFGIGLVLMPRPGERSLAKIQVSFTDAPGDCMDDPDLEALRRGIPSARGLPLLRSLARGRSESVVLDYLDPLRLAVMVEACR